MIFPSAAAKVGVYVHVNIVTDRVYGSITEHHLKTRRMGASPNIPICVSRRILPRDVVGIMRRSIHVTIYAGVASLVVATITVDAGIGVWDEVLLSQHVRATQPVANVGGRHLTSHKADTVVAVA